MMKTRKEGRKMKKRRMMKTIGREKIKIGRKLKRKKGKIKRTRREKTRIDRRGRGGEVKK